MIKYIKKSLEKGTSITFGELIVSVIILYIIMEVLNILIN